jgi:hypothetical protein
MQQKKEQGKDITRKEALSKMGKYGKYAALTALGTYMILQPKKAQATSPADDPGWNRIQDGGWD